MNRLCFRVVFNRARGLFMAVHEGASSRSSSASPAASVPLACLLLCAQPLQAQIAADPAAPGRQQPTVLAAPNGVPVVDIQTPSAAGVSRNTYRQFDVGAPGAILNNSRGNVQTQLGGWVQGNPWLAQGSARVILNEVRSSDPSRLRGALEVAGARAEVIVANPAGIVVDGGSFINTSRVTLTTGTPLGAASTVGCWRPGAAASAAIWACSGCAQSRTQISGTDAAGLAEDERLDAPSWTAMKSPRARLKTRRRQWRFMVAGSKKSVPAGTVR